MSDETGSGDQNKGGNTGYSAEYVKSLRDEAASWRVKYQDEKTGKETLEQNIKQGAIKSTISSELTSRNLDIDVDLIKLNDGEKASEAVDRFLKKYPQFDVNEAPKFTTPKPLRTKNDNSNVQKTKLSDYKAVKNDPIARASLREQYRGMLRTSTNTI